MAQNRHKLIVPNKNTIDITGIDSATYYATGLQQ